MTSSSTDRRQQQQISVDETQIYDRQIRLWGLEAQNRLRNSSVLLVGLGGLGAEVAKNLMLSGLKSLTLMDNKQVSDADTGSQFLIPPGSNGKNRAEASLDRVKVLNPMVEVRVDTEPVDTKPESFFQQFDLVILLDQPFATTNTINKLCRKLRVRFQSGAVFGWIGYAFFDFNNHEFLIPKPKPIQSIVESVLDDEEDGPDAASSSKKAKLAEDHVPTLTLEEEEDAKIRQNIPFPSFEQTFDIKLGTKKQLRRRFSMPSAYFVIRAFLHVMKAKQDGQVAKDEAIAQWKQELEEACLEEAQQKFNTDNFTLFVQPPLCPVCAIVGSILSQEAIKALSQNNVPLKSTFLYSVLEGSGAVCEITA